MRILKIVLGLLLLAIVAGAVAFVIVDEPRPEGVTGPEAEAMAEAMMTAAGVDAWNQNVGAIEWDFGGRRDHLWDRQRHLVRVRWPGHVALVNLTTNASHITKDGQVLSGEAQTAVRKIAYEAWANDSFWLNPIAKLKDEGTQRAVVETDEGEKGLLITYGNGGVTPGDSYLWLLGQDGLPKAWRMWVSIIPIGGLELTWQDYKTLAGAAKVATRHEGPFTLELTKIKSAPSISELYPDADPFALLFANVPKQASSKPAKPETPPEPAELVAPDAPTGPAVPKPAPSPAPVEEL